VKHIAPEFTPVFWWGLCCPIMCLYVRSEFRVVLYVAISAWKRYCVHLYLQWFVGGLVSYLRYLCLFVNNGVPKHNVLCFCFVCLRLVILVYPIWIINFWVSHQYSLTFLAHLTQRVMWAIAITWRPSVVRRKLFQKSSPLKVLDQWKPNLVWIITRVSSFKIVSGDAVHQPTWPLLLKHMVKYRFWVITQKPLIISKIWQG
jgi:hypothetical protein